MINGKTHAQIILDILKDGEQHLVREFLDAGLCEYRARITDLRRKGYEIASVEIGPYGRPGYQIIGVPVDKQ